MPSSGATSSIRAAAKARVGVAHGGLRQLVEQGLPVGEVAVDRGPRDAGRLGDVVHARLLALRREQLRGAVEDRGGDALLQSAAWGPARTSIVS